MAIVLTSLGKIKGRITQTKQEKPIYSFRGIPYAEPPVGNLRFAAPQPIKPWNKILNLSGKRESPISLQVPVMVRNISDDIEYKLGPSKVMFSSPFFQSPESKFALGQEDCLYLNVFTPMLPGAGVSPIYPVIVWIHGGAFCVGSNDSRIYGPDYLLDYGVVLVTINYR